MIFIRLVHCFTSFFSQVPGEIAFSVCKISTILHILFHLYEISKVGKTIETENIIVFALGWGVIRVIS